MTVENRLPPLLFYGDSYRFPDIYHATGVHATGVPRAATIAVTDK